MEVGGGEVSCEFFVSNLILLCIVRSTGFIRSLSALEFYDSIFEVVKQKLPFSSRYTIEFFGRHRSVWLGSL